MASLPFESDRTLTASGPIQIIQDHLHNIRRGCLTIGSQAVQWFVYIDCGQVLYITHSVDPIDRLDCHLKRVGRTVPAVNSDLRTQIRLSINLLESKAHPRADLQGLNHLVQDFMVAPEVALALAQDLSREALESLIVVTECSHHIFEPCNIEMDWLKAFEFESLLGSCRERVKAWQTMGPVIYSPYQRPYMFSQLESATRLAPETQRKLGKLLKGFSFRHLAILLNQDELKLVRSLYPLIEDKAVLLRDPQSPYSDLPVFSQPVKQTTVLESQPVFSSSSVIENSAEISEYSAVKQENKCYRIACIDDSPAMLQTIERFLENEELSLFLIQESRKALIELMRIKPDLILLDVGMPQVDGYELCRLLRKNSLFKAIPIIMVTGNTGLIDRAKAKLAGTTDYMTKPFTQPELQKMVFRHLA